MARLRDIQPRGEGRASRLISLIRRRRGSQGRSSETVIEQAPRTINEARVARYLDMLSRPAVRGGTAPWYAVTEYAVSGDVDASEALRRHGAR